MAADDGSADLVKVLASRQGLKPEHYNKAIQAAVKSENLETARVIIAAIPPSQLQAKSPAKLDAAKLKTYSGAYKGEKSIAYVFAVNDGNLIGYSMEPVALMTLGAPAMTLYGWVRASIRRKGRQGFERHYRLVHFSESRAEMKEFLSATLVASMFACLGCAELAVLPWPNASGVADGKPVPAAMGRGEESEHTLKTPIPGLAHSSPVVWGSRVFCHDGSQQRSEIGLQAGTLW